MELFGHRQRDVLAVHSEETHLAQPPQSLPSAVLPMRQRHFMQPVEDQAQQVIERHANERFVGKIDVESFHTVLNQHFAGSTQNHFLIVSCRAGLRFRRNVALN